MTNKEFGSRGEYLARLYLEQKGYEFIRAGYQAGGGEIDLVMRENDEIVFVEVKTRTHRAALAFGRGSARIDREKQKHILRASRTFLREEKILCKYLTPRYDAIELYLENADSNRVQVLHTPCAFGF